MDMKNIICGDRSVTVDEFSRDSCFSPEQFLSYINSLIDDPCAVVSFKAKRTLDEECRWMEYTLTSIELRRMTMLIAQWNDQIVGASAVSLLSERRDHVAELGISLVAGFRGYGLGAYLLREIICRSMEYLNPVPSLIRVSTFGNNGRGIRFYQKHGFREVTRIPGQFQDGGQCVDEVILLYWTNTKEP